jgi:acyl-CoA reductase-like NAD-dependent aldehyde dehydrogenase
MQATRVIEQVGERAQEWARLGDRTKAQLLRACATALYAVREDWVRTACTTKRIDPQSELAGEEWIGGVAVSLRALRLYAETLEGRHPLEALPKRKVVAQVDGAHAGRVIVEVFPRSYSDRLMMPGLRVDLELAEGVTELKRGRPQTAGLALVLGAGNIDSILVFDLLDQMIRYNRVAVLKFNPVNAAIREPMARAFAPLISAGYLGFVDGGAEVGAGLSVHPRVDHLHLTGSNTSFDAMVWGDDPEQARRRRTENKPRIRASVTAKLGAVTPILVVPGAWSSSDLRFHARQVAAMAGHNNSCNCNAAKLVVTARYWPQRAAFLSMLREELAALPGRAAWYPGAHQRWQSFREAYPNAEEIKPDKQPLPWLFIPDVPLRRAELACNTEAFSPVLAETSIAAQTPEEFLARAVAPVNEEVFGTLSCVLLAPAHTPALALETAIQSLRYGCVCVNTWPGLAFGLAAPSWGAFPGHDLHAAGSGIGHVHEPLMLDGVLRSIVRAPFRPTRRPAFDPGHRKLRALGRAWARYESKPSLLRLAGLALPAWRG